MILVLGLLLSTSLSFAASTPFIPEVERRFQTLEALPANQSYTADGISNVRIARATYGVTEHGGSIAPHTLGVSLPAKALIRQVWFQITEQFVDAGSGTVALSCEDAGNLYVAADVTGMAIGTTTPGVATGVASTMVDGIGAACELTATVAGAAQTAGIMNIFVEYVIHD